MARRRRLVARARSRPRSRCGVGRHRRGRRHCRRNPCAGRPRGNPDRGRSARHVERLPDARGGSLSHALSGFRRPEDEGQGDRHPAGPLRRRRNDRQLDEFVPHARIDARVLAADVWPRRVHLGGPRALVRANGGTPRHRTMGGATERQQRGPREGRGEDRRDDRVDSPQRQGLLEPRILRSRLPDQCQAVDARHHDSRRARPRRDPGDPGAGARIRASRRPCDRVAMRGDGFARRACDGTPHHRPRPRLRDRSRRHRHARAAAPEPRSRPARHRRHRARFSIRRSFPPPSWRTK